MNNDKGFTLVEVIAALAVVAIVSTSLFQMFVTSSYANYGARVMDIANVVAVQQAEDFKADPEGYSPGNIYSYNYYKGDGTLILGYHDLAVIPAEAVIMVKSELPDLPATSSNEAGYNHNPDFAGTIDLSLYPIDLLLYPKDLDVKIKNTNEIGVEPAGSTFASLSPQDSSKKINNTLPIKVIFSIGRQRTINITNDSDVEAKFYVYNTNNSSDVTFETVEGASSISYVPATSTSSSNKQYDLTLTVFKVTNGVVSSGEMFTYSANKYLHNT